MNPNEKTSVLRRCDDCDFTCSYESDWDRHISTRKHKNLTKVEEKTSILRECNQCDFTCSYESEWRRHISSRKHKRLKFDKENKEKTTTHNCNCGKTYKHLSTLSNHKKQCGFIQTDISANIIFEIVKQNKEIQQILVDQNKIIFEQNQKLIELSSKPSTIITTNSNNTNNTNNSKFNLNFFLNEQCKDALNITDFVSSLQLQLKDLENTGQNGFVEGISQIFIKGLKELDVHKRPIHCSDLKRETMYVKDQDIWEKENDEKEKLYKTISQIANKNIRQIPIWVKQHPNSQDPSSKENDQYLHIMFESMGGKDDDETNKYYDKIVKKVSKEVAI
jgi:hypothetical protein